MHRTTLASILILSVTASSSAQEGTSTSGGGGSGPLVTAAFSPYGAGCAGTGWRYGNDIVVPASAAASSAMSNNAIPFSWTPLKYQQVFLGSEIAYSGILLGLGLRQDEAPTSVNRDSHLVELEISLGGSTLDHTTLTTVFANNFNSTSAPQKTVFSRRRFALPRMPPTPTPSPATFFITIPFDLPYPIALPGGENLVIEVVNWGNTNGNAIYGYPLDAGGSLTTTRLYSNAPTDLSGTLGAGYGLVMAFKPPGSSPAIPTLYNANQPRMGGNFHFGLIGTKATTAAVLLVGRSNSTFSGIPLPFDLAPLGAPGCSLLASAQIVTTQATAGGGDVPVTLPIPSDAALDGANVYLQFLILDPGANALGVVTSNGGAATIGT